MREPVKAVLIGAGQRGADSYAPYALAHPDELRFVAVAEPDEARRAAFAAAHGIPQERQFAGWDGLMAAPLLGEMALVATQDLGHLAPAVAAMEHGYHVLLEKPMSNDPAECAAIARAAERTGRHLAVCHVLRYTPFFSTLKELLDQNAIGRLIAIQHIEKVSYWLQAHSFVRGSWCNSETSSPMILAKSCHDLDILLWLADAACTRVSSFGALTWFKAENAPAGAPERCTDGCAAAESCPFYAPRIYLDWQNHWQADVLRSIVSPDPSPAAVRRALETGPYGRCVYCCENNVVDHQTVNLEFANEVTASFTMSGFTHENGRTVKLMGTEGQIDGDFETNEIRMVRYRDGRETGITLPGSAAGHGGGDAGIMRDFVRLLREGGENKTAPQQSLEGHMMAFAAEQARLDGSVVRMAEFVKKYDV